MDRADPSPHANCLVHPCLSACHVLPVPLPATHCTHLTLLYTHGTAMHGIVACMPARCMPLASHMQLSFSPLFTSHACLSSHHGTPRSVAWHALKTKALQLTARPILTLTSPPHMPHLPSALCPTSRTYTTAAHTTPHACARASYAHAPLPAHARCCHAHTRTHALHAHHAPRISLAAGASSQ